MHSSLSSAIQSASSTFAASHKQNRHYALHIPEITSIIAKYLTQLDIIHCRNVSHQWRKLFSPFLLLHGICRNYNPTLKTHFEEQLQTLGPFVYSLKQVIPIPQELETIQRTCPNLGHVGLCVQRKQSIHLKALVKFLENMHHLESITLYSFDDSMVATLLQSLGSYQHSILKTDAPAIRKSSFPSSSSTIEVPSYVFHKLEIGNASHSLKFARIRWEQVMFVLLRHPGMTSLTLRDAQLCSQYPEDFANTDWSRNILVRTVFGAETQRQWNGLLDKLGSWRMGSSKINISPEPSGLSTYEKISSMETTGKFSKMTHLVLDGMQITEELLCYILNQCPALKTLELSLAGSIITSHFWEKWLPNCNQLTSFKAKSSSGNINIDVPYFWRLAPPTLTTFQFTTDCRQQTFPEPSLLPNLIDLEGLSEQAYYGDTLVTLELNIGLRITDRGLSYIMSHCRSLVNLVIEIQYFADWEIIDEGLIPMSSPTTTHHKSFPSWSCGRTLKNLELQVLYLPQDSQLNERIHMFMRRLDDLQVLNRLSLPLKLLSDLSESRHEDYLNFTLGVLEHLEQQDLLQDQFPAQVHLHTQAQAPAALVTPVQDLGISGTTMHNQSYMQHLQQHLPGTYQNILPQMPTVREVILSSNGSFRLQIRMRHLHILMEALPGLATVWAAPGLCGLDSLPWFKQLHDRFQAQYGTRRVALNLGSPAWGE
ncbi:hypothetical protein FBU30_004388 [Linnemannia zychae]|nr:hypothetical protein FBU30_004388 [Linnemannia zychae]